MKNILITGGAGFIGSNIAINLVKQGYNVTILDNLSRQIHGENKDSTLYRSIKGITNFILGDVCNKSDWKVALKGQDAIIHLAAETGTTQSMYQFSKYTDVNVVGTANLHDVLNSERHNIKKIVLGSSRSVYGEGKYYSNEHGFVYPLSRKEEDLLNQDFNVKCPISNLDVKPVPTDEKSKINPLSIYATTKCQQENLILQMGEKFNIQTVILRYQNVFGPGQSLRNPYTGVLSIFSTRILNDNDIEIYEDGKESRDFVYIDDVVEGTISALTKDINTGSVFNIGSGKPNSIYKVATMLFKLYKKDINILITGKFRLGDIRHSIADLKKSQLELDYHPNIPFSKGISKFVDWVKTQEIETDNYEKSLREMEENGLIQ